MQGICMKILLMILLAGVSAGCGGDLTPEQKALDLAKKFVMSDGLSAEKNIDNLIRSGGNDIKPLGWDVEEIENQVFLVKYRYNLYSLEMGIGERGYFFRVDLKNTAVADVTDQYIKRMAPLSKPYRNEEEIVKTVVGDSGGL